MRLLVRIDHTGDVTPFCRATEGRRIDEIQLHNPWQAAWIRDALVTFAHPDGATFFVVEAPGGLPPPGRPVGEPLPALPRRRTTLRRARDRELTTARGARSRVRPGQWRVRWN
jgi:hypothetical protein